MSNRRKHEITVLVLLFFGYLAIACATAPPVESNLGDPTANPGQNESVLIVRRNDRYIDKVNVMVDGKKILTIGQNEEGRAIISNGHHTLYAEVNADITSDKVDFEVNSKEISFTATIEMLYLVFYTSFSIELEKAGESAITIPDSPIAGRSARGAANKSVEDALYKAGDELIKALPKNSTVAIISVASNDTEMAEFVIDELAYVIVNAGSFKVVDRKSLDTIRSEQKFQMAGEVDDDSAVSIGKLLGANIVITGNIGGSGSTRRLRLKALDVKTAQIVAMSSQPF
ncbi:MAG: CsgG/HfaB family protein [Spirochaetales bacterium]|jgi:hypothetical protein|nr:CsgG/HfaB family protein [Spirochaetales bacterium]